MKKLISTHFKEMQYYIKAYHKEGAAANFKTYTQWFDSCKGNYEFLEFMILSRVIEKQICLIVEGEGMYDGFVTGKKYPDTIYIRASFYNHENTAKTVQLFEGKIRQLTFDMD